MSESPRGLQPCRFSSPRTYVELVSNTRRCRRCTPFLLEKIVKSKQFTEHYF